MNRTHTVQITDEQIDYIRSLHEQACQVYAKFGTSVILHEHGQVSSRSVWECAYCHRGSYDGAGSIPHAASCIITRGSRLMAPLVAQMNERRKE